MTFPFTGIRILLTGLSNGSRRLAWNGTDAIGCIEHTINVVTTHKALCCFRYANLFFMISVYARSPSSPSYYFTSVFVVAHLLTLFNSLLSKYFLFILFSFLYLILLCSLYVLPTNSFILFCILQHQSMVTMQAIMT